MSAPRASKRCGTGLVAMLAVATAVVISDSATPALAAGRRDGIVLSPTAGQRLPARPVLIEVRGGKRARVRARLNGHAVGECICGGGVRKLRVSETQGLRHGRNVLRVSVRREGSDRRRHQKVVFWVRRDGPLAGAGLDRQVGLDAGVELHGTASTGSAGSFRWRVLQAPPGSALAVTGDGHGGRRGPLENLGPRGRLVGRHSPTPTLRPDLPGSYRLQLEVRADHGRTSRDDVTLRVDPDPLVRIETMAKPADRHSFGVQVGDQFYPDPGSSKDWLQVVALKPDTLELISNRSYDCPEATQHPLVTEKAAVKPCLDKLRADLEALKPAKGEPSPIVIAVSQPPDSGPVTRTEPWQTQPPVGIEEVLYRIGLPPTVPWLHRDVPLLRGRFSAIGRFGGPATRHDNVDLADLRETGAIKGFLLADNKGYYSAFEAGEFVPFDTQAEGSGPNKNVISIGSRSFTASFPGKASNGSRGGFQVVLLDRHDLGAEEYYFDTGDVGTTAQNFELELMTRRLKGALDNPNRSGVLAFVQSLGDSRILGGNDTYASTKQRAKELVDLLSEHFGATRNRAFRALDEALAPKDSSYRLIATGGTTPGAGLEAEGPSVKGMNGVPAQGYLTRSPVDYGWEVEAAENGAEVGGAGDRLRKLAISPPGHWPEHGNAGRTAAIAWVGSQIGLDTRRSLFWTHPYSVDFWAPKVTKLQGLTCPAEPQGFNCASDFAWARQELIDEIGWLETAHAYVKTLAEPFAKNQLSSWADVANVAAAVNDKVQAPQVDKTVVKVGLAFQVAGDLGEEIPVAGKAVGIVNDLYRTALEWAKVDNEGTEAGQPFSVSVADAGTAMAKRLQAIDDTLEVQLVNVIAADYRKLRTVGLCAGQDPACPDGPLDAWQYTTVDQGRAAPIIHDGIEASLYTALMPARYRAWAPPVSESRTTDWSGHQPAGQTILGWECPFHTEPETGQVALPLYRNLSDKGPGGPDRWQVLAYGYRTGSGTVGDPYRMHLPQATVTDRLFKPPVDGGLGLFPESFYWGAFGTDKTSAFASPGNGDHEGGYPLQDSEVRWITKSDPVGIKQSSCGY